MGDRHANLEAWLGPCKPCEKMLVYDRYGTFLGRVTRVNCEDGGEISELVVTPPHTIFEHHPRTRLIDYAHCRVHAGAVHTSYAVEQLEGAV